MGKAEKTNVMRLLEQKKIAYQSHAYTPDAGLSGEEIAQMLGENPDQVFKTLVTRGKSGQYYVFVIPVAGELELRKAAKAVGEKSIDMIPQKELLPLTGYIHGGCSPIGMKKPFPTVIHESVERIERICFSAGKVGYQVEIDTQELGRAFAYTTADVIA